MSSALLIAVGIFILSYIAIVSEKVHRTVAALLGGGLMLLLVPAYTQEIAFEFIDLDVIFLLMGMMVIAYVLSETGVFQWLALQAVILGRGNPLRILQILALVTALTSAVLNNVTVVVLIVPVTMFVADSLQVSPHPFLIAEVLASNIGGAATLVGDPPNILIGSAAGIDFTVFLVNAGPFVLIALLAFILLTPVLFGRALRTTAAADNLKLDTTGVITQPRLLRQTLIILGLIILGFLLQGALHLGTATISLLGAAALLLWTKWDPEQALREVEWATLLFFMGLFILVGGLVHTGAIALAAAWLLEATGGNLSVMTLAILWGSTLLSGIVDNIPYAATMIPLIQNLGETGMRTDPLWWALVFGADLGGNATIIGASANVVVASLAARSGHHISFGRFLLYGLSTTLVMTLIASVYLWLQYL